jgi:hypothetical protein
MLFVISGLLFFNDSGVIFDHLGFIFDTLGIIFQFFGGIGGPEDAFGAPWGSLGGPWGAQGAPGIDFHWIWDQFWEPFGTDFRCFFNMHSRLMFFMILKLILMICEVIVDAVFCYVLVTCWELATYEKH